MGGPIGLDGFYLDAQIVVNTTANEFYKQPFHYLLGHFSKFMPPGSKRVHVKVKQTSNDTYNEECSSTSQDFSKKKSFQDMSSNKPNLEALPLPTLAPWASSTAVRVLASLNEDGSQTVSVYNPWVHLKLTLKFKTAAKEYDRLAIPMQNTVQELKLTPRHSSSA